MEIFGIPAQALYGQLALGLVNGAFYALLSLGLAIIFGLLNLINFAHGAQYMLGAYVAWMLLSYLGIGFWGRWWSRRWWWRCWAWRWNGGCCATCATWTRSTGCF